jgi:hypothetical protein
VPLSVGFAWMAFVWLLIVPVLPGPGEASGTLKHVYGLFSYFGPVAALGAATFLAYIVGVITTHKFSSFFGFLTVAIRIMLAPYRLPLLRRRIDSELNEMNELRDIGFPALRSYSAIDKPLLAALSRLEAAEIPVFAVLSPLQVTREKFLKSLSSDEVADIKNASNLDKKFWKWIYTDDGKRFARHDVATDLPVLANRLLLRERELYGRYDRNATESEFRLGLMLPLGAIAFVLVAQSGWFIPLWNIFAGIVAGYAVLFALLMRGLLKEAEANSVILEALEEGLIDAPTIEALNALRADETRDSWFRQRRNRSILSKRL